MPVLAETWTPQEGAGPVQQGSDGANLHLFSSGSSLCTGIARPRVWCLLRTLQPQRDAVLDVRNEKVKVYQSLCSTLAQS